MPERPRWMPASRWTPTWRTRTSSTWSGQTRSSWRRTGRWRNGGTVYDSPAALQAAQDAAIFGAQARYDEAEGLRVESIRAGADTKVGKQLVTFSDGEKVMLSKQQIAALRSM